MDMQKQLDFIETYRNYVTLSRKSKEWIEFYVLPAGKRKGNLPLKTGALPEAGYGRKKGFRE